MDQIRNGWFSEINDLWPGQSFSLKVDEVLHHEKSDFQDVLFIKTTNHGNALILDGIIQCTEHDEFAYQEMISFLPLCAHPKPSKVLIVGGGDGGVAREVVKHPAVETVVQVEIDGRVVDLSKDYLKGMAKGFESSKLELIIGDGFEYMRQNKSFFDVIITDSSDPVGPAVNLFTESYFGLLKGALRSGGVICSQSGTVWADLENVQQTVINSRKHFPVVRYALASVPTYPSGQIGFLIAGVDKENDLASPKLEIGDEEVEKYEFKYYNKEVHSAAFVLPNFAKKALGM